VLEIVALRLSSVPFNAIITYDGALAGMVGATVVSDDCAIIDGPSNCCPCGCPRNSAVEVSVTPPFGPSLIGPG
jgi:hypothetical protein